MPSQTDATGAMEQEQEDRRGGGGAAEGDETDATNTIVRSLFGNSDSDEEDEDVVLWVSIEVYDLVQNWIMQDILVLATTTTTTASCYIQICCS